MVLTNTVLSNSRHTDNHLGTTSEPLSQDNLESSGLETAPFSAQDNTKIMDGSNKIDLKKNNGGESSSDSSEMNNSEDDQSVVLNDHASIIHAVVGNKSIPLVWCAEAPQFDQSEDVSVIYCLRDLENHMCVYSSGYLRFGPGQERSQISRKHVIAYKVDSGNVSVTQQSVTQTFGVNSTFYIPLGSPYKLKNISDTEHLILYFSKMSNDSLIN